MRISKVVIRPYIRSIEKEAFWPTNYDQQEDEPKKKAEERKKKRKSSLWKFYFVRAASASINPNLRTRTQHTPETMNLSFSTP